jgi:hypothetical protein
MLETTAKASLVEEAANGVDRSMTAFNAILPLVAVLFGSLITYWINVRTRARSKVDDAFREAIAAVAEMDSRARWSDNFSWDGASEEEEAEVLVQYRRESVLT